MMGRSAARERKRIIVGIGLAALFVFLVVGWIERAVPKSDLGEWFFWLQMVTGTSWPTWDVFQKNSPFWFAVGATFQIMLGIGPLLAVLSLIWVVLTERRGTMKLSQLIRARDAALKLALKQVIRRRFEQIDEAALSAELDAVFAKTNEQWKKDIEAVFLPPDKAEKVLEELEQER